MQHFSFVKWLGQLHRLLEPYRDESVVIDGFEVPKSVVVFASMLQTETRPDDRFSIYENMISECRLAGMTQAAAKYAKARYAELGDIASLMGLSNALTDCGDLEAGLARATEALALAIEQRELINDAASNLMRAAVRTGSAEHVNTALEALVGSTQIPRKGDSVLETDWIKEAEALGADKELTSWVRSVAERGAKVRETDS